MHICTGITYFILFQVSLGSTSSTFGRLEVPGEEDKSNESKDSPLATRLASSHGLTASAPLTCVLRLTGRKWEILRSLCDHGKVSWMALNYPVKDSLRYFDVFWQSLVPPQALADGVWLFKLPGSPCPSWVRPPHTHPNNIPDRQRCETWNIASGHFLPFQAPAVKDDAEEKIRAGFGWQSPSKGQHAQNGAAYVSFFWQSKLLEGIFTVALETLVIY